MGIVLKERIAEPARSKMEGKFIVLEGINGCGKTTQLDYLASRVFRDVKPKGVFLTREPNDYGGDKCGLEAIDILKSDGDPYENAERATSCFALNRRSHNNLFAPMLEKGIWVLSDRYWHSNFAFQHAQGVSYEHVSMLNNGLRVPDLTIIVDVPVEEAFKRLGKRDGTNRRKFDRERDFLEKVRQNYLELPEVLGKYLEEKNVFVVDGVGSEEGVFGRIEAIYEKVFEGF